MNEQEKIQALQEVESRVIERMNILASTNEEDARSYVQLQREPLMQLAQILRDTVSSRIALQKNEAMEASYSAFDNSLAEKY